jgi:transposase
MTAGLFPDFLPGCTIGQIDQDEQGLLLQAHVNGVMATCPVCEQSSMCVHSSYVRSPQDLPIAEQGVRIRLRVRRFRCTNPTCTRKTFVERLPELLPVHAQRTTRLTQILRHVGHAVGGEAGARAC